MAKARKMLFPPYLNQGSKGTAVMTLQQMLYALGFGKGVVCDADYGPMTAEAVKNLQAHIGFRLDDVDGNLGPKTRARLKAQTGIDVDAIPGAKGVTCTTYYREPNNEDLVLWRPD